MVISSVGLLDVNALIALLWDEHPFHASCSRWFAQAAATGWATCPITEAGCTRVLCNPAFTPLPPSVQAVLRLLSIATRRASNHHFWKDELPISSIGTLWKGQLGHKQITDVYLLALAKHHKGKLVTFDRRILHLAAEGGLNKDELVLLKP